MVFSSMRFYKLQSVQNAAAGVIDVIYMFNKFRTLGRGLQFSGI